MLISGCPMEASADVMRTKITTLPDEVLYKVLCFDPCSEPCQTLCRTVFPLVCKRWREVLYLQGAHHAATCSMLQGSEGMLEQGLYHVQAGQSNASHCAMLRRKRLLQL